MIRTQAERTIAVETPLGPDALLLQHMSGFELLGRPFEYDLDLVSEDAQIDPDAVLGDTMTVRVEVGQEATRYFHGHVSKFTLVDVSDGLARYRATLVPWIWFLTRTADCRIFQEKTVPDIILEVFRDNGFSDFDNQLTGTYRKWEYCVQYRETDFNFVSRLMEQEGIYYYFEHKDGKHILVLSDSINAHEPYPEYATIKYYPPNQAAIRDEEHISSWSVEHEVQPTTYAHNDFDFKGPQKMLRTKHKLQRDHAEATGEIYDYPGEYVEHGDGQTYAQVRIEELQANFQTIKGAGNTRGLGCGYTFELAEYPREEFCKEYLVTSANYQIEAPSYDSSGYGGSGQTYSCSFTALDSTQPFRPPRITPKPSIQGPQTAIVCGPDGEEIWTDKYGRVKVQFHWDRYGEKNESSSCWVRVAQIWAGAKWGGMFIPRIGHEVVIEFLEGDPDHPLITGRVYNGDNMPPYDLPANKTQSGVKSRSSKGGTPSNFNEIRFEDKKGSEEFFMQAEKDHNINVKNNRTDTVGNDETTSIGHDRTETVGNDETITINGNRTETVQKDETITLNGNRTETVAKDETITINGARTETVIKDETITITGGRTETVSKNETVTIALLRTHTVGINDALTVGAAQEITVGAAQAITVGAAQAITVGGSRDVTVAKDQSQNIGKNDTIQVGKNLTITAGDQITLTTGSASITMKKDGTIIIKGKDITIEGSGKMDVKASKNIVMKGQKILQN